MSFNFNAVEVFKIAVKIEENGKKFYDRGLKIVDEPGVRKLFEELAAQEVEHKKKFESLLAQLPAQAGAPTVWDPDNDLDRYIKMMADEHVFNSDAGVEAELAKLKGVEDALKLAMDFEKDSVLFFLTMEDATESEKGREQIRLLVKEEQEHLRRLTMELRRIKK